METRIESDRRGDAREDARDAALEVRLLGPMAIRRAGAVSTLPASRKVRALLAYLALASHPVPRSQLCELLWDVPNDPRGELRWCLSKLRTLVDTPERRRVQTSDDAIRLDLGDCDVDAIEVAHAFGQGIDHLPRERQRALCERFGGDFLEGLDVARNPAFNGWLAAQRRRYRDWHAKLLEQVVRGADDAEALPRLERWLGLAPFDVRVHRMLLEVLTRRGRFREAEEHLAAAMRTFEAEGLDAGALRLAWRSVRAHASTAALQPRLPSAVAHADDAARALRPALAESTTAARGARIEPVQALPSRRASVAVLRFVDRSVPAAPRGVIGDALARDVITRLAKLRSLFVIAPGTVFALADRSISAEEAGRLLGVDYVVSGSIGVGSDRLEVTVELVETSSARIVWAETLDRKAADAFAVLDEIGNRIVAEVASEIEAVERNRAILRPPSSLDAWEAHHRGLWHMYRFSQADNERGRHFFEMAVRLDPTFSRAHAGLSFTHWQNAFQRWAEREAEIERAHAAAGQSLMADDRDPAAHWAMGRALWLRGSHDASVGELEQAVELSPNFAMAHYTLAFVHSQAGDPHAAIESAGTSLSLSPFDPMLFGMLGARAMAHVRLGEFEEAAAWAVKAAARPNAHVHIRAIAAFTLALAGALDEARAHAAAIRKALPGYGFADFIGAFRFDAEGTALFRDGAKRIGMA